MRLCATTTTVVVVALTALVHRNATSFVLPIARRDGRRALCAKKPQKTKRGGGGGGGFGAPKTKKKSSTPSSSTPSSTPSSSTHTVASRMMDAASEGVLGRAVAKTDDPFYQMIPSLVRSRFPLVDDAELDRVAGVLGRSVDPDAWPLEDEVVRNPHRPHDDLHAYMPGLGPTKPFHDPESLPVCRLIKDHHDTIVEEYRALVAHEPDRFQSVTSMNYESGWRTLVLFYNGRRIPDFPYHLCPVTTQILETVPLAGRIAGFNRQAPATGIPKHSDGNNMWLTAQSALVLPPTDPTKATIRVGPETRSWPTDGTCLVYDTTYEHETFNACDHGERVVLHVDFFNTLAMTDIEIEVMRYVYDMRETFMRAEGVAKVGARLL